MVGTSADDREITLGTLLARRARQASDGRLVIDAVGGLLVGLLVVAFRPPLWSVQVSAAAAFVAFGTWGISDRMLENEGLGARGAQALRALRGGAAALGVVSGLALVATTMALMLGTWIS